MMYFQAGRDYFDDLEDAGIVPAGHVPTRELAEATWHRIGNDVLVYMDQFYRGYTPPERPIWAEQQFGPPGRARPRLR